MDDRLKNISTMSKGEVVTLLEALNLEHRSSWTLIELREILSEYKKSQTGNDIDAQISRMSRMKKGELMSQVRSMGALLTGNETAAQLLRKARKHLEDLQTQQPAETLLNVRLDFGSHRGKTYEEVFLNLPGYCEWATTTFREDPVGCYGGLRKFAVWLEGRHQMAKDASGSGSSRHPVEQPRTPRVKTEAPSPREVLKAQQKKVPEDFDIFSECPTDESGIRRNPPQWDGREETLQAYLLETRIWKGRSDDARSNASWLKVSQPPLPMDLSNKPVHLLSPEETKEPKAKK
jgi:hypothetical protein